MSPRALGASLALVAAILLAVALLFPAWWSGHPIVDGKERAIQEVHVGLFAAKGCNTRDCDSTLTVGSGAKVMRYAEAGVTALASLCAIMLAVAMWRTSDRRKTVAALALVIGPLAGAGAVFVLLQGVGIQATQKIDVPVGWGVLAFGGGILATIAGAVVTLIAPPPPLRLKTSNPSFHPSASSPGDVDALLRDLQQADPVPLAPNRDIGGGSPLFEAAPQLKPLYELGGGGMPAPPPPPDLPSRAPTPLPRERIAQLTGRPTPTPPPDSPPPPPPRAKTPTTKPAPPPPSAKKASKPTLEAAVAPPPPPSAAVVAPAGREDSNPITAVEVDAAAKAAAQAEAKRREAEAARVAAREEARRQEGDAARIAEAKKREAAERAQQDQAAAERRSKRLLTGENPDTDTDREIGERRAEIVLPTGEQPVLPSDDISAPRVTPGDRTDEVAKPVAASDDGRASTENDEPPAPPPVAPASAAAAAPARQSQPKLPITTAPSTLPPPKALPVAAAGPTPACPQCEAPMAWVEEHLRFYCKACRMYF
jgi:hypothetical protein